MTPSHVAELDPAALRRWLAKAAKNVFKDYASLRRQGGAKKPSKAIQ